MLHFMSLIRRPFQVQLSGLLFQIFATETRVNGNIVCMNFHQLESDDIEEVIDEVMKQRRTWTQFCWTLMSYEMIWKRARSNRPLVYHLIGTTSKLFIRSLIERQLKHKILTNLYLFYPIIPSIE